MDKENAPQDDAEMKAISQGLHQLYDPVLDEPVPARIAARDHARPRRGRRPPRGEDSSSEAEGS